LSELYPHQRRWIEDLRHAFCSARRVMGQLPTGAGKTVCLAHMARAIAGAGQRVVIAVHRQEIFLQTSQHLVETGIPHCVVGAKEVCQIATLRAAKQGVLMATAAPVVLASMPTLMRRPRLPAAEWLFVDEAHHAAAKQWAKIIESYADSGTRILGVTATAGRHDGKPLTPLFETLVRGPELKELVAAGYLSPFEIKVPQAQVSREEVHVRGGEYVASEMAPRARKVVGDAISQYRKWLDGEQAIVFVPSVAEAERTAEDFKRAGYAAANIDGRMKEVERGRRIAAFGRGDIRLLVNDSVLSEGLDVPAVRGMISLRPTYSKGRWMQDIGRALRFEPGKTAVILDHAGNTAFHGHPFDLTDFGFHGSERWRERAERAARDNHVAVRQCKGCFMPFNSALGACPHCGLVVEAVGRQYAQVAGELVDVAHSDAPEIAAVKELMAVVRRAGRINGELVDIAGRHGMGQSWVDAMRERVAWWQTPVGGAALEALRE